MYLKREYTQNTLILHTFVLHERRAVKIVIENWVTNIKRMRTAVLRCFKLCLLANRKYRLRKDLEIRQAKGKYR